MERVGTDYNSQPEEEFPLVQLSSEWKALLGWVYYFNPDLFPLVQLSSEWKEEDGSVTPVDFQFPLVQLSSEWKVCVLLSYWQ